MLTQLARKETSRPTIHRKLIPPAITVSEMATDGDVVEKLQDTFQDAPRRQLETLTAILEHNGGISYLRPYLHGDDVPINAADFLRAVPISCYDDYADHINKLADGISTDEHGHHLLSVDPLLCFFYR